MILAADEINVQLPSLSLILCSLSGNFNAIFVKLEKNVYCYLYDGTTD